MAEDIGNAAATDEQSTEHQGVRREDPLLPSLAELQRWTNRRQRHGDDRQVEYYHELGDTYDSDSQRALAAVSSKTSHAGNIPTAFEHMQLVKFVLVETTAGVIGTPRELPIVGGHLALDFANTVDDPYGPARYDHAGTYQELVDWSVRIGVLLPDQASALLDVARAHPRSRSTALRRAHQLRRILIEIFTQAAKINSGEAPAFEGALSPTQWSELRSFITEALTNADLASAEDAYELSWALTTRLDALLWPIAMAALELLTSPQVARVKKCAGCPWVFVDQSKNLSRRWCAMNDCGTHEKIRRYVSRRAARKQSGRGS